MRSKRTAFTLVEVLIVVAIMGLIGALVVPQMLAAGTLTIQAAARMVIADILYAQNDAIARQSPRRVVFDPANNRYTLTDSAGTALTVPWKGGAAQNYVVDLTADSRFQGVTLAQVNFGGTNSSVLEFDDMGAPLAGGTIDLVFDNTRYRITVAAFTGRVTVAPVNP